MTFSLPSTPVDDRAPAQGSISDISRPSALNTPGAAERDAIAYIAFLDAQKEVNRAKKIGTQGYCMGGPLVVKTAAAIPDRIGAAAARYASFTAPVDLRP